MRLDQIFPYKIIGIKLSYDVCIKILLYYKILRSHNIIYELTIAILPANAVISSCYCIINCTYL